MCGVQILVTILNKYFLVEITSLQQQRRQQDNGQMKWGGHVILAFLCIFWLKKRNIKNADLVCSFSYWAGEPQIAPKNRQRSSSWHVFTNFPNTNLRYLFWYFQILKTEKNVFIDQYYLFVFSTEKYW